MIFIFLYFNVYHHHFPNMNESCLLNVKQIESNGSDATAYVLELQSILM